MVNIGGTQRQGQTNVKSTEVAITLTLHAQRRILTFREIEAEIPLNARYMKSRRDVRPSDIKLDMCQPMEEPYNMQVTKFQTLRRGNQVFHCRGNMVRAQHFADL
jgi:hypothetical protein